MTFPRTDGGSKPTAADVKASYDRIVNPLPGVISARRATYAAISSVETPDARTVIFDLRWPEKCPFWRSLAPEPWRSEHEVQGGSGARVGDDTHG